MFARLLKSSAKLYLGYGVVLVAGLGQLKLLSVHLSQQHLGMYFALQGAVAMIAELAKLGFPLVFAHYIPKMQAQDQDPRPLAFWALGFHGLAFALFFTISMFVYWIRPTGFTAYLPLATLFFFPMVHYALAASYVLSSRRPGLYSLLNALSSSCYALVLLFLWDRLTLANALTGGALVYGVFSALLWVIIRPIRGPRGFLRGIVSYWRYALATSALSPVFVYADRLIAAWALSYDAAAIFGVARKIESVGRNLLGVPMDILAPEASFSWFKQDKKGVLASTRSFTRFYFGAALVGVILISLVGRPVISLISSPVYQAGAFYLALLWAGACLSTLYYPYTTVARAVGNMRLFFVSDLLWTVVYLAFALITVKALGLVGLALAPMVASAAALVFTRTAVFGYLGEVKSVPWTEVLSFGVVVGFGLASAYNPWWLVVSALGLAGFWLWTIRSRAPLGRS